MRGDWAREARAIRRELVVDIAESTASICRASAARSPASGAEFCGWIILHPRTATPSAATEAMKRRARRSPGVGMRTSCARARRGASPFERLPCRFRTLRLLRHGLDLFHDAEHVATPQLDYLLLRVAATDEFDRDVDRLTRAVVTVDAAATVEVGADTDVVDADELDGVVDVIDQVLDVRARRNRVSLIECVEFRLQLGAFRRVHVGEGVAAAT